MGRVELKITFECPACKQINESVSFSEVVVIETMTEYIGSGDYLGGVQYVNILCTGCKEETEINF